MMSAHLIIAAAVGGFTWTFLEYVMHRRLGHDRRFRGNPFGIEHVRHHAEGCGRAACLTANLPLTAGGL